MTFQTSNEEDVDTQDPDPDGVDHPPSIVEMDKEKQQQDKPEDRPTVNSCLHVGELDDPEPDPNDVWDHILKNVFQLGFLGIAMTKQWLAYKGLYDLPIYQFVSFLKTPHINIHELGPYDKEVGKPAPSLVLPMSMLDELHMLYCFCVEYGVTAARHSTRVSQAEWLTMTASTYKSFRNSHRDVDSLVKSEQAVSEPAPNEVWDHILKNVLLPRKRSSPCWSVGDLDQFEKPPISQNQWMQTTSDESDDLVCHIPVKDGLDDDDYDSVNEFDAEDESMADDMSDWDEDDNVEQFDDESLQLDQQDECLDSYDDDDEDTSVSPNDQFVCEDGSKAPDNTFAHGHDVQIKSFGIFDLCFETSDPLDLDGESFGSIGNSQTTAQFRHGEDDESNDLIDLVLCRPDEPGNLGDVECRLDKVQQFDHCFEPDDLFVFEWEDADLTLTDQFAHGEDDDKSIGLFDHQTDSASVHCHHNDDKALRYLLKAPNIGCTVTTTTIDTVIKWYNRRNKSKHHSIHSQDHPCKALFGA